MKRLFYFKFFLVIMLSFSNPSSIIFAKKFQIQKLWNCKSIRIGEKRLKEKSIFDDSQDIHWTNALQLMEVVDIENGNVIRVTQRGFEKYEAKTLAELMTKEKSLGHRSYTNGKEYYANRDYYLIDSLHFAVLDEIDDKCISEVVWKYKDQEVVSPIKRTDDGKFYIVTPDIFGSFTPCDVDIDIRDRATDQDWINNVYHRIHIIFIPQLKKYK